MGLFNGQKTICVAIDDRTDPLDDVVRAFSGHDVSFVPISNNPRLGERAGWDELWATVGQYTSPLDYTFYAHAKGVSKPHFNAAVAIWTAIMYQANLDFWPLVRTGLENHKCAGAFKSGGLSTNGWHFAGAYFWVRNSDAVPLAPKTIMGWCGTEAWPGTVWKPEEAFGIFGDGCLYDLGAAEIVNRQFQDWKKANEQHRTVGVEAGSADVA
jgi:hypothetical protein